MSDSPASPELVEARAMLEVLGEALEGRPVGDFWESFPLVRKAQDVHAESKLRSGVVVDSSEIDTPFGRYTQVTVSADGANEGVGTSRYPKKALGYALEDLAAKVSK